MQITPHNQDEFKQQYQEKRQLYETFALRLQELLKELTHNAKIPCDKIVFRVKTLESFLEKIERKLYTAPFEQIKDLAGVRVVTYYLDDVERVRQLIYQEFTVDEQHSVDKITHLGAEEFGYRSVISHYCGVRAARQFKGRCAFCRADGGDSNSHDFAACLGWLSHKIDYKLTSQAPGVTPPLVSTRRTNGTGG